MSPNLFAVTSQTLRGAPCPGLPYSCFFLLRQLIFYRTYSVYCITFGEIPLVYVQQNSRHAFFCQQQLVVFYIYDVISHLSDMLHRRSGLRLACTAFCVMHFALCFVLLCSNVYLYYALVCEVEDLL